MNRVAVVTGGSRGIGAAICKLLAARGAKVAVVGRDEAAIEAVVAMIRSEGPAAIGVVADCTDFTAIEAMRARVEDRLGPAEIVIADAGGSGEPMPFEQISEAHWRHVVDANLTSTFLTIKSFLPGMIERRRGAIVTMASSAGRLPSLAAAPYAAAKAGIIMLTRQVAQEVGKHGIRVNCLAPSAIRTERNERLMTPAQQAEAARHFPLGRIGTPEDVANAAMFLVSEQAAWLTGVTLDVAGGRIMV